MCSIPVFVEQVWIKSIILEIILFAGWPGIGNRDSALTESMY